MSNFNSQPITLKNLAENVALVATGDTQLAGITHNSGQVGPGFLYVAIPGLNHHGIEFLSQALERGAVAVASDAHGCAAAAQFGLPHILLDQPRVDMARLAAQFYDHPENKLRMVGVTGTNGKTTITQMLRTLLRSSGEKVGVIGTLGSFVDDVQMPSSRTTPESTDLFALLAQMVALGATTVCMEVSSHALELERVAGITFEVSVFTNLTQDHLDFHHDMDSYFAAKAKLFTQSRSRAAVIDTDNPWGRKLALTTDADSVITVGDNGQWRIADVELSLSGSTKFRLNHDGANLDVSVPMYGVFNAKNAALCLAACQQLGLEPANVAAGLTQLPQVPGRMEIVAQRDGMLALVDYAHTPDAVSNVLTQLALAEPNRIITVIGCGGDRDASKRPIMGQIAAKLSDLVVVTDDNPRTEAAADIRKQVLAGALGQAAEVLEIGDRELAITTAISLAEPGDVIAVLGKGHEVGQEVNGVITPFDDAQVILEVLANA